MKIELYIQRGDTLYEPVITSEISWATERIGTPGKLGFSILKSKIIFEEGDAVRLQVDGNNVFSGFIFTQKWSKSDEIQITAYDQLRYLKNKDTYVYENKTAADLIRMIADDFNLQVGTLDPTEFIIANGVEDNSTLFDIIYNALDAELSNKKKLYILYDDFGKLTLKALDNMQVGILIDQDTAEDFDYTVSIDNDTYNQIKLSYDNKDTGKRDIYMTKDTANINKWGVLQYYDTLQEGENGQAKAEALIQLYNHKSRNLRIDGVFGDHRVRAGSLLVVRLDLDVPLNNFMLVERCEHRYLESIHTMNLTLRNLTLEGR